ncbi:MAG: glycosyltransferase family 87 protein [Roseiflexaceae bacterium]|nr:DUF2029 domain-containing protein [Roseiflexus sp.]MDW8212977.1 glycosyltransferase family 87 protein [Roseiflexaceae bacterium]
MMLTIRTAAFLVVCAVIITLWLMVLLGDPRLGIDFYPLYFGARRIVSGESPYGAEATQALMREWSAQFAAAGIAYPLPLLILITPLSLLPLPVATAVWTAFGIASCFLAVRLVPEWRYNILLPFVFLPFHRSVVMGQATLVWLGLAVLLIQSMRMKRSWLSGILILLLTLKPQDGLLFALAGLVWAWREQRQALWWFCGSAVVLISVAFLARPTWMYEWIAQTRIYQTIVAPPHLLPFGLVLIIACWRHPWWARVAAAQVVCFPLSDLYSALPLLLCWLAIGGWTSLIGAGLSWLWSIGGLPNTLTVFWWLIFIPLCLNAAWSGWLSPRRTVRHPRTHTTITPS